MNNPYFVQAGLGGFPEYAYIVFPDAHEKFSPGPLLNDVEYHCLLIDPQASALMACFDYVVNDGHLKHHLDRINFGSFAISPVNSLYDFMFQQTDKIEAGGHLINEAYAHDSWKYSYKVAGVTLDRVFAEILDNGDYIDGLVMDIKGVEVDVLESLSYYPRVVIVEPYTSGNREGILKWATDNDYELIDEIMSVGGDFLSLMLSPVEIPKLNPNLLFVRR